MNQTWEMGKNLISGPILACLAQIFLWVLPQLIVIHCRKLSSYSISRKIYDPSSRKWQKISFWVWFRPVRPKFGPPNFFYIVKHCSKLSSSKEKLMNQTRGNGEKPNFGPDSGPFSPNFGPHIFFVGFTSPTCYTFSQAITVCNFKENVLSKLKKMIKKLILGLI